MCGIVGGLNYKGPISDQSINLALGHMKSRGPDCQQFERYQVLGSELILGHTRLSIIDLSEEANQPFASADNSAVIVFNGEIYNYKELKSELQALGYSFRSSSDTEVLLYAWKEWGADCLKRLVGMFTFCVWDKEKDVLFLAKDAFGIKPLYYLYDEEKFIFASEPRVLRELRSDKLGINWQVAYDYLVHGDYCSTNSSFFLNLHSLEPGHYCVYSLKQKKLDIKRWWFPSISERKMSFADARDEMQKHFLESVRLHLRSDVPIGVALSGGIDSSAVSCAIRHLEPDAPINTFSFVAKGFDISEEPWIDIVNDHIKAKSHKIVVDVNDFQNDLDDMIKAQGEPFGSTSIYAQYRVFKLIKESGVTVSLDGQGADEMLAGYMGYPGHRAKSLVEKFEFIKLINFTNEWSKWPNRRRRDLVKRAIGEISPDSFYNILRRINGTNHKPDWIADDYYELVNVGVPKRKADFELYGRRLVQELLRAQTKQNLPALLRHADRNSMRFSVESRVPFLSLPLVEFALSLPEEYLLSTKGETKSIFREAMRGIVPDQILDRRDKIGFSTPEMSWLRASYPKLREKLLDGPSVPFIKHEYVVKKMDMLMESGQDFDWQVWRWINFIRWYQLCVV